MPMSKKHVIDDLLSTTKHFPSALAAEQVVDAVTASIRRVTAQGLTVNLRGFGQFEMKSRAARVGRNVRTGEPVEIAATRKLTFKDKV
jgi:DNA-binding protein HU-beta